MSADLARKVKILGFRVVAETVENQTQESVKNVWRCRRWGKWTKNKQENWLFFLVYG